MSSGRLSKILIEGGRDNGKGKAAVPSPDRRRSNGTPTDLGSRPEGVSLYEDTFSRAKPTGAWMKLAWLAMVVAVAGAVLLTVARGPVDLRIKMDSAEPVIAAAEMGSELPEAAGGGGPSGGEPSSPDPDARVAALSAPGARRDAEVAAPVEARASSPSPASESSAAPPAGGTGESVRREPAQTTARPPEAPRPNESSLAMTAQNSAAAAGELPDAPEPPRPRNSAPAEVGDDGPTAEAYAAEAGGESEALQLLVANSMAASRLVEGGFSTLVFRDWRVVQSTPREVWVDVVAGWTSGGSDVHFIWSVERETGAVRALSQAARNLEAGGESAR